MVKPILAVTPIAVAVYATLPFRYFFAIPAGFAVAIAVLVVAAIAKLAPAASSPSPIREGQTHTTRGCSPASTHSRSWL
jgi:hypothetical protein